MKINKRTSSIFIFLFAIYLATSCSRLSDDEFQNANANLTESHLTIDFSGNVNSTSYRTIVFTNRSTETYEVFNIAKANDVCSAFSLHNITDASDNLLFDAKDTTNISAHQNYSLAIALAPGESLNVNIKFNPPPCELKTYQPTLIIYANTTDGTKTESILLNATVSDNSESFNCGEIPSITSLDEIVGEEPSRLMPALEDGYYYAMIPYKIHGYIQPTEGFASLATEVYAYFGNPDVPEPGYEAAYVPVLHESGNEFSVPPIGPCRGFHFPTSLTDAYFLGAKQILTTDAPMPFYVEVDDPERLGEITLPGFVASISATVTESGSILPDSNGDFRFTFQLDLSSNRTVTNEYLQNAVGKVFNLEGEDALNIYEDGENSYMYGSDLRHGEFTVVGIGEVLPENYIMADEAVAGLVDTPTYLFFQLHFKVSIIHESQIPIEENIIGEN